MRNRLLLDEAICRLHANFVRYFPSPSSTSSSSSSLCSSMPPLEPLPLPRFNWPSAAAASKQHQNRQHNVLDWTHPRRLGWTFTPEASPITSTYEEARQLLRVMLNTLPFDPDEGTVTIVERFLRAEQQDQGRVGEDGHYCTSVSNLPHHNGICVWQGDITRLEVDAVVNAANKYMLGCNLPSHACIDNAIHTAAGPRLRAACRAVMEAQGGQQLAQTGRAIITPAFLLPASFVIHTLGPVVDCDARRTPDRQHSLKETTSGCRARREARRDKENDSERDGEREDEYVSEEQKQQLASCYVSCLKLARAFDARTIAFPCISTGVFGFPQKLAAQIAHAAVSEELNKGQPGTIHRVVFNTFLQHDTHLYRSILGL